MAQAIVVEISVTGVRLGNRRYKPDEEIEPDLISQLRPELGEFLPPNEARAKVVANAIQNLHLEAIRQCDLATNNGRKS